MSLKPEKRYKNTNMTHYDHPARIMEAEARIKSLQAALREALDSWEAWLGGDSAQADMDRITELRDQFLYDKETP